MESHGSDLCKKWKPPNPPRRDKHFQTGLLEFYYSKGHSGNFAYHVFAAQLVRFKNTAILAVKQEKTLDVVFSMTLCDKPINLDFAGKINLKVLVFCLPVGKQIWKSLMINQVKF